MYYLKLCFKLEVFCSVKKYILQLVIIYIEICIKTQCNNIFLQVYFSPKHKSKSMSQSSSQLKLSEKVNKYKYAIDQNQ